MEYSKIALKFKIFKGCASNMIEFIKILQKYNFPSYSWYLLHKKITFLALKIEKKSQKILVVTFAQSCLYIMLKAIKAT